MDKKLLDALNNLSDALEYLSESMKDSKGDKNKSSTSSALTSSKLEKKIDAINKGVKEIQSDNKKILKNQEQLLKLAKQKDQPGAVGDASDPKQRNKVKDGLATIMLIAVGVLAIGLAFKIVGGIDFLSVIALALALPLVAMAFEKIAQMKDLKPAQMITILAVVVTMSLAIVAASFILGYVQPVGFWQGFTAIMIASVFSAMSFGLGKLIDAFSSVKPMGVAKMILFGPLMLTALSFAIAGSSYALGLVQPVGFFQAVTAIMIAAAFGAIGYGLGSILDGMSKIKNPAQAAIIAALLPVVFVALAFAIAGTSYAFGLIQPITLTQFFTALLIGIVFIPLSYGLQFLGKAMSKITLKQALLLPVVLVLLATAIMLSSYLFQQTQIIEWQTLFNISLQAVVLAVIGVVLGSAMRIISKVSLKDAIMGSAILLILVTAIMISSWILSVGNYENYPTAQWAAGVGLSILLFAPAVVVLGILAMADGGLSQLLGAVMVLVLALAITGVSHILANGKYDKYPPVSWSASVILIMVPFAVMTVALGAIALSGIGAVAFALGIPMILGVAYTIVEVSKVLGQGKYDLPGIGMWALSVIALYTTFTPLLLVLGAIALANAVLSVFGANPWESAREMIVQIAQTIVDVAGVLSKGKFVGGPTLEWATGVYIALGAFAPVYAMLVANKIMESLGAGGIGPKEFSEAIGVVVSGIMFAAEAFKDFSQYEYPSKEWAEGVGLAIGAFSPVYAMLVKNEIMKMASGEGGIGPEEFSTAIMVVCRGILDAAKFFGENIAAFDLAKVPKKEWGEAVGGAIGAFMPALEFINKNASWWSGADPEIIKKAIKATAEAITDSSMILATGNYANTIPKEWVDRTSEGIKGFVDLATWLNKQKGSQSAKNYFIKISTGIKEASLQLGAGEYQKTITKDWIDNVSYSVREYVYLALWANNQKGLSAAMKYFGNITSSIMGSASEFKTISNTLKGISSDLLEGMIDSVVSYVDLAANYIHPKRKWLGDALYGLGSTVWNMLKQSFKFRLIKRNMQGIDSDLIQNLASNVKYYVDLAIWLSSTKFDKYVASRAVDGLYNLSRSYSELGRALSKINRELEDLDIDKLNALRNLNASVVLMSLMDPEQFKSMMDELEEKGGVLIDALMDLDEESGNAPKKPGQTTEVKSGGSTTTSSSKTMDDLYTIMDAISVKLDPLSSVSGKISTYIDDIRTGNIDIIKKPGS